MRPLAGPWCLAVLPISGRITVEKSIMPMPAKTGRRQHDPALKLYALKKRPLPWGEGPKSSRVHMPTGE